MKKNRRKNRREIRNVKTIKKLLFIGIIICLVVLIINSFSNTIKSKLRGKAENQGVSIEAKIPNELNFSYEESLDGIQVPVPTGYTASSVDDERYVNGITTEETWYLQEELKPKEKTLYLDEELTFTSTGDYAWTQDENTRIWKSGNYQIASSTSTLISNQFTVGSTGGTLRINWSVCSQTSANTDYAYYTITNVESGATIGGTSTAIYGTEAGTSESSLIYFDKDVELGEGKYQIEIKYTKNASTNTNLDSAFVKSVNLYSDSGNETKSIKVSDVGDVVWNKDEATGIWSSGNYHVSNSTSTLTTENFTISGDAVVRINWSVSSQVTSDYIVAKIINTSTNETITTNSYSNTVYGTNVNSLIYFDEEVKLSSPGIYTVQVVYTKDASSSSGLDRGYLKNISVYTKEVSNAETTVYTREKSGGFVIYEGEEEVPTDSSELLNAQKNRNQYVWVPISSEELANMYHVSSNILYGNYYSFSATGYTLTKTGGREPYAGGYDHDHSYLKQYMEGISRFQFLSEMRQNFYEMLESVATYGGFYIGRYETGNLSGKVPKVVKVNSDIHTQTWYKMYIKCKNLSGTNGAVKTNMIWGIQYDETLKWLIDSGEKSKIEVGADSTSWGNYINSTFSYMNSSGNSYTKNKGSNTRISTGSAEYTKANNIYDLAGNVWDWTMESNGSSGRYCRGGSYDNYGSYYPAHKRNDYSPDYSNIFVGCRATLYIK